MFFLEGAFSSPNMATSLDLNGQEAHPYSALHSGTESVQPGFFVSNPDIVDWVVVELRTGTTADTKVASRAAFLRNDGRILYPNSNGDLAPIDFTDIDESITSCYIVIHQRNHLPVMSANAVPVN